jgi:hypothetical protein
MVISVTIKAKPTAAAYESFLANGGTVTFEVEAVDIGADLEFEKGFAMKSMLKTGFELRPTPSSYTDPREIANLLYYGGTWDNVGRNVYSRDGEIWYKQLSSGDYEATCNIPPRQTTQTP